MPKRTGKRLDVVQNARRVVLESVGESETITASSALVSQVMAAMGRKGGLIGGKRRFAGMSAEERTAFASAAATARWSKRKRKK